MKLAVAVLVVQLALSCRAHAQGVIQLRENPLTADLPYVFRQSATGGAKTGSDARSQPLIATPNWNRERATKNRSSITDRLAPPGYFGARQAQFHYMPHYSRRSELGLTSQRKPLLAPMPVTYSPLMDPFFEEKEFRNAVEEALGYYP